MKIIKQNKILFSVIIIITIFSFVIILNQIFNPNQAEIEITLTLRVGAYENKPKIYTDDDGNIVGLFPELIEHIASKEGWKIEYVHGTWVECLERLENNTLDIMVDVAYSTERAEKYDFHNIDVITNWGIVYKQYGSSIETLSDLSGKKVAVMAGSIHTDGEMGIKNITKKLDINCTFIELVDYSQVFEVLDNGGADVGIVNRLFGMLNEDEYNIEKTGIIFNPRGLRFAFPKNAILNQNLIISIDQNLLDLMRDSDSIYYELLETHIFFEVEEFAIPDWLVNTVIISIALIIIFFSTSALLENKVRSKTAELQKSHGKLEEKVLERTQGLHQANIKLQELDRLKSMFLASMSHELRTPLNSIIGFTSWVLMGMEGELNEEQAKQLTMVQSSGNHLLELINDILDISKIEAGKVNLVIKEFTFDDLVDEVVSSVLPLSKDKGLNFISDVPENLIITSDRRRVKQILMNLVSNAIKFSDEGNIKIEGILLNNKGLEVKVSDTGVGIKENDLKILFQPFQQIDMTSTKKHGGTGLGLYLCKKILELLHGDITVSSQFGKGSDFTFIIPINFNKEI